MPRSVRLFAAPVLAQVPLNLAGGAYTDRIGGRRIMLGSCWAAVVAGVWLMFAHGFWMLMLGQLALVLSRAAFWPATWAMASELPGARGIQLGRLNAATRVGQIAGTALCGFLLAAAGFQRTFLALADTGLMAFFAGLATKPAKRKPALGRNLLLGVWRLFHQRIIQYSMLCAYLSALPFSLSISFYPLLLADFGYGEGASGILLALRALGAIAAGLIGRSGGLEHAGFKAMAFQQPVELGAVAPGQARRLGDVAPGDLEDAHQVVALEGLARLVQRGSGCCRPHRVLVGPAILE